MSLPPEDPPQDTSLLTRRELLAGAGAAALGAWGLRGRDGTVTPEAPRARRLLPEPVALVGCDSYEEAALRPALERVLELCPPPDIRGGVVVLKPNFVEFHPGRPVTTRVEILRTLVALFRDLGAREVVIGEGPGHRRDTVEVWGRSGLLVAGQEDGFPVVDLNHDHLVRRRLDTLPPDRETGESLLRDLWLPRTLLDADLVVSVPKLKTHHWAGCTLAMKNLFGVVPGAKYGWPKNLLHYNGIPRSIVELAENVPTGYAVVDGVQAMEGDGPIMGEAVDAHVLLGGRSLAAVDWMGARLMGFDPRALDVFRLMASRGRGLREEPELRGEGLGTLRRDFRVLPQFEALRG